MGNSRLRVLGLLLCITALAFGQTSTSSISGTVTDSSGSVVPGATVTVTNVATGVTSKQTTTDAGLYSFAALPVGNYSVGVEMAGFKSAKRTNLELTVNTPLTADVSLEIGQPSETVTVESKAELLQTSNAVIGNVVSQQAIRELPLNGRNPLALLVLEPGVVQRSYGGAGSGIHVNGSRDRSTNVTVDGIEANESTVPNPLSNLFRLNPDNTQEYKVTTSNSTAEEGRNSGAVISVATRSGSNQIHGTAFEFLRNTALNANDFFNNATGLKRNDIKLNQYGFEVSGPIVKNRTFFFGSWAGQKINFAQPVDITYGLAPMLYTASALSGQYRYFIADPNNPLRIDGQTITANSPLLVDSAGNLRAGVRTCGSPTDRGCVATYDIYGNDPRRIGMDPTVKKLMASVPLPNSFSAGDGLNTGTYTWAPPTKVRGPNFMVRIDHTLTQNQSLFGRYMHSDQDTFAGDPLNGRPQLYPGFPPLGEVFRRSRNLAIGHRWVISPTVVNEFTAGISRFGFLFTQGEANPDWPNVPSWARSAGTAFNNFDPPYLNTPRTYRVVTTPQIIDNLSIIRGAHQIRTGLNIRLYRHNDQRGQPGGVNVTPLMSFSSSVRPPGWVNVTGIAAVDNTRLLGTVNDLLGIPARLSQTYLGDLSSDTFLPYRTGDAVTLWNEGHRLKQYNFYVQDEWKVTRNVVLNAGVRWEVNLPPTESGGRVYVPDRSVLGNEGLVTFKHADSWFENKNLGAIGPHVGITWAPTPSTVFRTGYAIAYDPLSSFQVTAVAGRVPGLTTSCSSTIGGTTTPGCFAAPDVRLGEGFPNELALPTTKPSSYLTLQPQLLSNAPTLNVFDKNMQLPTVHQWNLTVQHELPGSFVAQASYVGRRGTHLFRAYDVNQISADGILPSFLIMQKNLASCGAAVGAGCAAVPLADVPGITTTFLTSSATRTDLQQNAAGNFAGRIENSTLSAHLRPNQQFNTITYLDSGGDSYYHSLQATIRKRFSAGLLLGAAYTLGKSIDNQSVDPVGASSGGGLSTTNSRTPIDTRDWRVERGRSDFDRRHVFTSNWVYEFPFGRGRHYATSGFTNQVIGGWSANGLITAMSGEPFSIRSGVRTSNNSHDSRAVVIGQMPELNLQAFGSLPGPVVFTSDAICPDPYTRTAAQKNCFAVPLPGENGSGRNLFTAPGFFNADLGLFKKFEITERVYLQFRAEAFNVLNHTNFDNPRDASVGSPSITSSQFGRTCCAAVAPPSTQTIIQTGEAARVIQFALKVGF